MSEDKEFTLNQALAVQRALREVAGMEDESFDHGDVIAMASDEIEVLLDQGKTHDEIAAIIQKALGKPTTGADVAEHYLSEEVLERWGEDDDQDDEAGDRRDRDDR
jgi:hypothetical protein